MKVLGEITASSTPDYDNWGWDSFWSCAEWIAWHKALKNAYGQDQANAIFTAAWEKQDSFEHAYNWCKYNSTFYNYIKKNFPDEQGNVFATIINSVSNVAEGVNTTANVAKFLLPAAAIALAIWGGKQLFGKNGK